MSSSSNLSPSPPSPAEGLPPLAMPPPETAHPPPEPAPGDPSGVPRAGEEVLLEHWIYGASPEKGYGTRAESTGLHPPLYLRQLAGRFTPVRVEKTTSGSTVVDARMIHPATVGAEIILSILGRGAADEYNRPTIQNHTVVIPSALLKSARLSLAQIEQATLEFDRAHPLLRGSMEPLRLPLLPPPAGGDGSANVANLRRLMTRPALETLAARLLGDPHGRTLVLCRGSSNEARNELLYEIFGLLCLDGDLPMFNCISDAPTLSAMNHFRLAISSRGVRADASWMLLDASIEKTALPVHRGRSSIYARIAQAYGV